MERREEERRKENRREDGNEEGKRAGRKGEKRVKMIHVQVHSPHDESYHGYLQCTNNIN